MLMSRSPPPSARIHAGAALDHSGKRAQGTAFSPHRYAARVVNSGVAETALRDDALVLDGIRRSLLQAGKRQDADRCAVRGPRLAVQQP